MNLTEAMKVRHSVRQYKNKPLEAKVISALQAKISIAVIRKAGCISSL